MSAGVLKATEAVMLLRPSTSKLLGSFATVAILSAGIGYAQQQQKRPAEVQKDLETAMKGEAFAYAKYMMFAEQARAHGHSELAALFENTAKTERLEHFREHAELAGLASRSDADNLRDAMAGENYETTKMYPEMAARARQAGDKQAAARFTEIGKDESKHHDAFASALAKLDGAPKAAMKSKP
jgi:rubrerythrin